MNTVFGEESAASKEADEKEMGKRLLSVVVVSFNTREYTLRCLSALCSSSYSETEIWVVDNGSEDGSVEAVEAFAESSSLPVHVIRLEINRGFGTACNIGVRASGGDFVAFVNSDAFVDINALEILIRRLESWPGDALVGPGLFNADGSPQRSRFAFPTPWRAVCENLGLTRLGRLAGGGPPEHGWLSGACLLFRRELWTRSAGFDESFFLYAEETDWQRRLWKEGCAMIHEPDARVVHLGGGSGLSRKAEVREHFFTGADRYMLKHFGGIGALIFRGATALGAALRLLPFALSGSGRVFEQLWILRRQLTRSLPPGGSRWQPSTSRQG